MAQLTGVLLLGLEQLGDLLTDFTIGHADVVLLISIVVNEVEETVIRDINLNRISKRGGVAGDLEKHTSWYSARLTTGTSMLWVEGHSSSSFLPVKMSMAIRWTLAWPCLPVLEVDMSTILQGRCLITTWPFLRRAEHCMGKVVDAPASTDSKV